MAFEIGAAARIVAIVGPTASGKSALAMKLSERVGVEIVSADSVQVYRGLNIGSGKPSGEDQRRAPHHLIDILELDQEMNAAMFAKRAAEAIEDIRLRGRVPVVTGGTGLYLTALLKGLFDKGSAHPELRARLDALAEKHGPERLHRLLVHKDPDYAARTEPSDRLRSVRALEVFYSSGRPFSAAQRERRPAFTGEALIIGLNPGREVLKERVTERVRSMLELGLVRECRDALERVPIDGPPPRGLSAIGYREVVARLREGGLGDTGDEKLLRAIVISTMQYAKRQMTYFRHQFVVEWFSDGPTALDRIESWLASNEIGKGSAQG